MKCPRCEKEINEQSKFCQYCGALIPLTNENDDMPIFMGVGILIIIVLAIIF